MSLAILIVYSIRISGVTTISLDFIVLLVFSQLRPFVCSCHFLAAIVAQEVGRSLCMY
jgi:hypothetical protein